ncbi:hypothetical protein OH76DRAFT_129706 [Lentinus brumalis]|uniref:MYND-type domain-containing protein n=1 Tax=Lentinus brumalis TaxID=2498619 RepID=A0A371DJX7_9APHY|nr:hypothetical protein OH76DRAFT_129706 [Polyporus brumalis]
MSSNGAPEPSLYIQVAALRRCQECGQAQDAEHRLQRCAGCFHILYCSKTCQKKAWKTHKLLCSTNAGIIERSDSIPQPQLEGLGFESFSKFTDVFRQWSDAHKNALYMCAKVVVMQRGGIAWSQNPQKMLAFFVTPRRSGNLLSLRNPSLMFQLQTMHLFDLEEHMAMSPDVRTKWEHDAPVRASMDAKFTTHPLYAGLLPTVTTIDGIDMVRLDYLTQFHPNPSLAPLAACVAPVRDIVLEDILHLALGSINAGFPLRPEGSGPSQQFLPGHFVRDQFTHTWQPLFADWTQYRRGQHKGLDETLDGLRSGIPPSLLIRAVHCMIL